MADGAGARPPTVNVPEIAALATAEFSTIVEADATIVVDRTMWWDRTTAYGAHPETAILNPAPVWHLAEGAIDYIDGTGDDLRIVDLVSKATKSILKVPGASIRGLTVSPLRTDVTARCPRAPL